MREWNRRHRHWISCVKSVPGSLFFPYAPDPGYEQLLDEAVEETQRKLTAAAERAASCCRSSASASSTAAKEADSVSALSASTKNDADHDRSKSRGAKERKKNLPAAVEVVAEVVDEDGDVEMAVADELDENFGTALDNPQELGRSFNDRATHSTQEKTLEIEMSVRAFLRKKSGGAGGAGTISIAEDRQAIHNRFFAQEHQHRSRTPAMHASFDYGCPPTHGAALVPQDHDHDGLQQETYTLGEQDRLCLHGVLLRKTNDSEAFGMSSRPEDCFSPSRAEVSTLGPVEHCSPSLRAEVSSALLATVLQSGVAEEICFYSSYLLNEMPDVPLHTRMSATPPCCLAFDHKSLTVGTVGHGDGAARFCATPASNSTSSAAGGGRGWSYPPASGWGVPIETLFAVPRWLGSNFDDVNGGGESEKKGKHCGCPEHSRAYAIQQIVSLVTEQLQVGVKRSLNVGVACRDSDFQNVLSREWQALPVLHGGNFAVAWGRFKAVCGGKLRRNGHLLRYEGITHSW